MSRSTTRILVTALGLVLVFTAAGGGLDRSASERAGRVFRQALITFAAARALDAAVSFAQGTELVLQPIGVGVTISAGELLDPVNDLVEQFASLMLVSATSLGLQNLLLRASGWWVLSALLSLTIGIRLVAIWFPQRVPERVRVVASGAMIVLVIVRFAMPVYAIGTAMFFERFLAPTQGESLAVIEETGQDIRELDRLDDPALTEDAGLMGRVSAWFSDTVERFDVEERIEAFRQRVSGATEHVLNLIVVFTLQTVLLPLGFLWLMPKVFALAFDRIR